MASKMVFKFFPHFKEVDGFKNFLDSEDHIEFEKADLKNDTDVFKKLIMENKLNCMMIHMKNTCFEWENFKVFCLKTGLCDIITNRNKGDMRTKFDMEKDKINDWCDVNFAKVPTFMMSS